MSIYTKTGDKGTTSLFDGKRVKKYALRVDTYGVFDECAAQLSVAEKIAKNQEVKEHLIWLEEKIFHLNAEIATAEDYQALKSKSTLIEMCDIENLEQWIDFYQERLPQISSFILPGETLVGAQLHVARTICRRGERRLIELAEEESIRSELLQFVNRLSDCLYIFSRVEDYEQKKDELVTKIIERYLKKIDDTKEREIKVHFSYVRDIFETCIAEAENLGTEVTVALVDHSGLLVANYSMPNALLVSRELAFKKAYSAIAMKQSTDKLQCLTQPGADFYQLETVTNGELVTFSGGIPIVSLTGEFTGAIGVSGGSKEEDQQIAEAGLKRVRELSHAK